MNDHRRRQVRVSKPTSIGDLIRGHLAKVGLTRQVREAGIEVRWPELVGAEIAAHTRVIKIDAGRLFVAVDEPTWRQELMYQKGPIMATLNAALGEGKTLVSEIMFTGP